MNSSGLTFGIVSLAMVVIATIPYRERQPPPAAPGGTRIVLLGTGNPPAGPISGDTNPTQATIDACRGRDVLIHEVLTQDWLSRRPDFHACAAQHHTTTAQLVELATRAKPRRLVLYHASLSLRPAVDAERSTPATLLREMAPYAGQVVVGRDLDVY
jgi:hypothetical protein